MFYFDFYGEADTWHTMFSLPAPQSTVFHLKLLPVLLKIEPKILMEKKNLQQIIRWF